MFAPDISTLGVGEGGLVKVKGETVGAYKDETGNYHVVEPICTHLGCHVLFNKVTKPAIESRNSKQAITYTI